jgi:hypothetical protein
MAYLTPPANFYREPGVTYDSPIESHSDYVGLYNTDDDLVTEISTDATMALNSDVVVPTQKAIRTFIGASPPIWLTVPLILQSNTPYQLQLQQLGQPGSTTLGHTAADLTEIGDANGVHFKTNTKVYFDEATDTSSIGTGAVQLLGGLSVTKSISSGSVYKAYYDPTHHGGLSINSAGDTYITSSNSQVRTGVCALLVDNTTDSSSQATGCALFLGGLGVTKNISLGPTLKAFYDLTHYGTAYCDANGYLNLAASHSRVQVPATETFKVLNVTDANLPPGTVGGCQMLGGLGVTKNIACAGLQALATTGTQVQAYYDQTHYGTLGVDSAGDLNLTCSHHVIHTPNTELFTVDSSGDATTIWNGALHTNGGASIAKSLWCRNATFVSSTGETPLVLAYDASNYVGFTVSSTGKLTIDSTGNEVSTASSDVFKVLNTANATSTITGAQTIAGGLGVADTIWAKEMNISNTSGAGAALRLRSASINVASLTHSDANHLTLAIGNGGYFDTAIGVTMSVLDTTASTTTATGALIISGGIGSAGAVNAGSNVTAWYDPLHWCSMTNTAAGFMTLYASHGEIDTAANDVVHILNTAGSSDIDTAALVVKGGISVHLQARVNSLLLETAIPQDYPMHILPAAGIGSAQYTAVGTFWGGWLMSGVADTWITANLELPRSWKVGTAVEVHVHCTTWDILSPVKNYSMRVAYALTESGANMSPTGTNAAGVYTAGCSAAGSVGKQDLVSLVSFATAIATANPLLTVQVYRNAVTDVLDTYTNNVYLHSISARLLVDKLGV